MRTPQKDSPVAHKFRFKVVKSTLPKTRREAVGRRLVDAARAAEQRRIRTVIDSNCK